MLLVYDVYLKSMNNSIQIVAFRSLTDVTLASHQVSVQLQENIFNVLLVKTLNLNFDN